MHEAEKYFPWAIVTVDAERGAIWKLVSVMHLSSDTSWWHFTYVSWYTSMTVVSRASGRAKVLSLSANKPGSWATTVSTAMYRLGRDCMPSRCRHSATPRGIYAFLKSPRGAKNFFDRLVVKGIEPCGTTVRWYCHHISTSYTLPEENKTDAVKIKRQSNLFAENLNVSLTKFAN